MEIFTVGHDQKIKTLTLNKSINFFHKNKNKMFNGI